MTKFDEYVETVRKLLVHPVEAEDELLDSLDVLWWQLTPAERKEVEHLSLISIERRNAKLY